MEQSKKYISDVDLAIQRIESFTEFTISFEDYTTDYKTQSAVERQLVIIGEALNKLNKVAEINLEHTRQIVGFRNRLVHAYDSIDNTIVWAILKRHIPILKEEIKKYLAN